MPTTRSKQRHHMVHVMHLAGATHLWVEDGHSHAEELDEAPVAPQDVGRMTLVAQNVHVTHQEDPRPSRVPAVGGRGRGHALLQSFAAQQSIPEKPANCLRVSGWEEGGERGKVRQRVGRGISLSARCGNLCRVRRGAGVQGQALRDGGLDGKEFAGMVDVGRIA